MGKSRSTRAGVEYVALRGFAYPCAEDLPKVLAAGGISKLTKEEADAVVARWVEVQAGDVITDSPKELVRGWMERGLVSGKARFRETTKPGDEYETFEPVEEGK